MRLIDADALECVVSITPKGVDAKSYNDGFTDALELMDKQPTIDAVPLDKLCEWLAANASYIFGDYKNTWKFEARHWEHEIREWMKDEGLDATD